MRAGEQKHLEPCKEQHMSMQQVPESARSIPQKNLKKMEPVFDVIVLHILFV